MAVKIRLARRGRKKLAMFDVVVADARAPRDGRFVEKIGTYNPNTNPRLWRASIKSLFPISRLEDATNEKVRG